MKKKIYLLLPFLLLILVLSACGNNAQEQTGSSEGEKVHIRLSTHIDEKHPLTQGAYKFKEIIEERSDGSVTVDVFPNLQLGSLREQVESTQLGTTEMTITLGSTLTTFNENLEVLQYPYILPTEPEKLWQLLDGEIGQKVLQSLSENSLKAFGFWPQGYKAITANKPILSPDDLRGLNIRVVPSDLLLEQFKAWGANPVSIDFGELYTALQQGTVDAQENPLDTTYTTKIYEVQKHMTILNASYQFSIMLANQKWFDSLSPEMQEMIVQAEQEARAAIHEINVSKNEEYLQNLQESGLEITVLTEEQMQKFIDLSIPLYEQLADTKEKQELLKMIQEF